MRLNFCVLALCALPCVAQFPSAYKHVDRVFWVVDDLDRATTGWQKARAAAEAPHGEYDSTVEYRGESRKTKIGWSSAPFAGITADFIQPLRGENAFSDFAKRHRLGVAALVHRVATKEALDAEVSRMKSLGVSVLQSGMIPTEPSAKYVLFDTEADGKYLLGIAYYQNAPTAPSVRKIVQYAFVAHDLEAVSKYWTKLGFPAMSFTHPALWDLRYHDQPGDFDAQLGWQRHGDVVYEWIQPLKGPTTYSDHMRVYAEGLHHIAFQVEDISAESAEWTRAGFPFEQGGAWGERDKPGYGRFAYQDTHKIGGIDIELLWNYRDTAVKTTQK